MPSSRTCLLAGLLTYCTSGAALAQVIDFETFPNGNATADQQIISTEYASLGVTFKLVSRSSNAIIGSPTIAKAGEPRTAFAACPGGDTAIPGQGVGVSFLTDDAVLGVIGDLLVEYATPVSGASGVVLDVDCREPIGNPPCEQWTIEAINAAGTVIDVFIIDAPQGPGIEPCEDPNGPGDARAFAFSFNRPVADISSIRLRYTGSAEDVGLAFDNFSPSSPAPPIDEVSLNTSEGAICSGDKVTLSAGITGGLGNITYRWQRRGVGDLVWDDISTGSNPMLQDATPDGLFEYRVIADDGLTSLVSDPETVLGVSPFIGMRAIDGSVITDIGDVSQYWATDQTAEEFWGAEDRFALPPFTLADNRLHLFSVATEGGRGLGMALDSLDSNTGGNAVTNLRLDGVMPNFMLQDDPEEPGFNDTYLTLPNGDGTFTIKADHTWGANRTDGYIIGPLDRISDLQIGFDMPPTNVDSIGIYSADGMVYDVPFSGGIQIAIEYRCPLSCPADINNDGAATPADFTAWLGYFNMGNEAADVNMDNEVSPADFTAWLAAFNSGCF